MSKYLIILFVILLTDTYCQPQWRRRAELKQFEHSVLVEMVLSLEKNEIQKDKHIEKITKVLERRNQERKLLRLKARKSNSMIFTIYFLIISAIIVAILLVVFKVIKK